MSIELVEVVSAAIKKAKANLHGTVRGTCLVENCPHDVVAKGFCNAHYLRSKKGRDMLQPVQAYAGNNGCVDCGKPLDSKGGWMRCVRHFKIARQQTIKDALVDALGGCCSSCGGIFPSAVYDFHHTGAKDADPSALIANGSIERIAKELERCVLLCANCHRIEHAKKL